MSTYIINSFEEKSPTSFYELSTRENFHRYLSENKKKKTLGTGSYIITNNTKALKRTKTNGLTETSSTDTNLKMTQ